MYRIDAETPAFREARLVGCVLDFVRFADADGTDEQCRGALAEAVEYVLARDWPPPRPEVDRARLPTLRRRTLSRAAFFGAWADGGTGDLVDRSTLRAASGEVYHDQTYRQLEALRQARVEIVSRAAAVPELWSGGEFGYAFSQPPYGMPVAPGRVQDAFDAVCGALLPRDQAIEIADWGSDDLVGLCEPFFEPGTEWWGVFAFTVHAPAERLLTVVLGSTTD